MLEAGQTPVDLKVVKLDQFIQALESYKGKIVVVDIWASWCVPCKKEFPHLVELHQKRAKEGVVCVSLTVDTPDAKETALEFLRSKGATFPNFLLDEPEEVWGNKWKIKGIPVVLVYGRDGELARKFDYDDPDNQFTYDDVNKFLDTLLAAKP
ncbi:MAG: TlpA family protein disulfide reductase [Gemmataceae bacterium]|nr:TlpA family protein disulfide reductase [Gemmataceae bacterium]MDW8264707.1 TlpA disulfide reductase family protein [Gemmataceae bacterium]